MNARKRFSFHSMRVRLTLWNVGVLALVLLVLGTVLRFQMQSAANASTDHFLASRADGAQRFVNHNRQRGRGGPPDGGGGAGGGGGRGPQDAAARNPQDGLPPPDGRGLEDAKPSTNTPGQQDNRQSPRNRDEDGPDGVSWPRLFNLQGKSFRGDAKPWDPNTFEQSAAGKEIYSNIRVGSDDYRVLSVPLKRRNEIVGVVQVARSLTPTQQEINHTTRSLLTLVPLALLIAGIGGAFLTNRALRPVRDITNTASRIEAENLSGRLPVTSNDEFGELAETFNGMLTRLEVAFTTLEQSYAQQQRFTADASHELRTPLTIIKAHSSLALSGKRTAEDYRKTLEAVDKAADRTNRIVQDLLLLAQSDAGQWSLRLEPTPLADVLVQAMEIVHGPDKPSATLNMPDKSLWIEGDGHSLIRLFSNLMENAARHTPNDGQITVSVENLPNSIAIHVTDTGEGIAPEHIEHLTERFYRVDAGRARRQGGTGLGLSICQSIVDAHHGTLTIESKIGEGTTVHVTLPKADEDEDEQSEAA